MNKLIAKHKRLLISLTVFLLVGGYGLLMVKADRESELRKSPEVRLFERQSDEWLKNARNEADFRQALEHHKLKTVALVSAEPGLVLYTLTDGAKASTMIPGCTAISCEGTLLDKLDDKAEANGFNLISVEVDSHTPTHRLLDSMGELGNPLLTIGTMIAALLVVSKMQSGLAGSASVLTERPNLRFEDVIGNEEAKRALKRVKAFMQDPSAYVKLGAKPPRGVLMTGPPGTGKTLLAKALAGESDANFISVDGSHFTAMFYGAGVAKVKHLFELARAHAPCVLFIDEIDGIGRRTSGGDMRGGEAEMNRIINRILSEMDGFASNENVVIVGATNHPDNIDPAMRRPGRFDMSVQMGLPTQPERQKLFDLYLQKTENEKGIDTAMLARMTPGVSPAEVANLVNMAASKAAEAQCHEVNSEHLLRAIETHHLGGEVSSIKGLLTPSTMRRLAYHEAGHALVAHYLGAGIVERVTVEPRGQALGVTHITRESEDPLYRQGELASRLAMMLGGREAELLIFGDVSTGASDDLKRASELAINMVSSLGFSKTFGLLSVAGVPKELLGPDVQAAALNEARALLEESQRRAAALLTQHRARLDSFAEALLKVEVLSGEPLKELLGERADSEPRGVRLLAHEKQATNNAQA